MLAKKKLDNLSDTASDIFYLIQPFGDKLELRDFVNICMVKDRIQDFDSVTCGNFQIYFYKNLFNPNQSRKIQNKTKLNTKTMETLLNEIFVLDNQKQNQTTVNEFA